jgi:hypothetical protein
VNSNSFYHGVISGGGFDYCVRIAGGNNTILNALVMEPYVSTYGHLVVESGEIVGSNIRIEGVKQPATVPLIEFKINTYNSYITGTYSGGLTIDRGDNFIDLRTGKSLDAVNPGFNLFMNAALHGLTNNRLPYWELSDTTVVLESLQPEILARQQVLKITIPPGKNVSIRPGADYLPIVLPGFKYDHCNFGAYLKTNRPGKVYTTMRSPTGLLTGLPHAGDSSWAFIGMTGRTNRVGSYNPEFVFDNRGEISSLIVFMTTPTLTFGSVSPQLQAGCMNSSGGIMTGTLSTNLQSVTVPVSGFLILQKDGNVFEITGTQTLNRINESVHDRFPKGTIITLLFNSDGMIVSNNAYLKLKSSFVSTANSSLTLISLGNGIWRELNRNL